MKLAAYLGNSAHAPPNSRIALISGYAGGADILHLAVRMTVDRRLVLAVDDDVEPATGTVGSIADMSLNDLRELNFAARFTPRGSAPGEFNYFDPTVDRRLAIDALDEIIPLLPREAIFLIEVADRAAAKAVIDLLRPRGLTGRLVLGSGDAEVLRWSREHAADAKFAWLASYSDAASEADIVLLSARDAWHGGRWSDAAKQLAERHRSGLHPLGIYLMTASEPPEAALMAAATNAPWVWSVATSSTFDVAQHRAQYRHLDESFAGTGVDRTNFALGYAKANQYASVTWKDGVHVDIAEYDGPLPRSEGNALERRVSRLEWDLINVAREWPFYSGGGVGTIIGISDDFAAEVTYQVTAVGQATTLEMAVVNVDPGSHRGTPPASFRDKDSFYDPHGAPPFVGVEHDEEDGFRINWNLGHEYDHNQYGRPVGDGRTPRGARLRLERRGSWFAAYYRRPVNGAGDPLAPQDWVCVGVARNDSLNPTVYLRCVGKRWRQERASDPTQHEPVIANHFTFRDLSITCFPAQTGD